MKLQLKNLDMGEVLNNKIIVLLCVFALSSCTSLELGVHYSKIAYNKCHALDNWQCLWYNK